MSLVAYGSSDESDSEETSAAPESKPSAGGLFSRLPAPKKTGSVGRNGAPDKKTAVIPAVGESSSTDPDPQSSKGSLFSSLPKTRKRAEPVKITIPQIQRRDVSTETLQPFAHAYCALGYKIIICEHLIHSQIQMMTNQQQRNYKIR